MLRRFVAEFHRLAHDDFAGDSFLKIDRDDYLRSAQSEIALFATSESVLIATRNADALYREPVLRRARAMAKLAGAPSFVRQRTEPEKLAEKLGTYPVLEKLGTYPVSRSCAQEKRGTSPISRGASPISPSPISLDGATVLFPDTPPAELADLRELHRLRDLGVRAVIVPHVANPDVFVRIVLRRFSRLRRFLHYLYLSVHSVAIFATSPYRVSGCRWETPPRRRVPHAENTDLCERYALFQGFSQLPPIPVAHADIEWRGGGRYSVWHRHVVFSYAGDRRWFMLVPRNRWTARFLELDAETFAPMQEDAKTWVRSLQALAAGWRSSGPPPRPVESSFVVLTHCLAPGGAERQWCYLAIGLKRLGHEVCVVATHDMDGAGSHYLPLLQREGVRFIALDEDEDASWECAWDGNPFGSRLPHLTRLLERLRPAAVFAQLDAPNVLAGVACHAAGVPRVVLSFRNYNPTHFPYIHEDWMLPCYQALAASPRVVLAGNSHAANRDYAAWIGPAAGTVHTVPNAIDADGGEPADYEQSTALRAALGIAAGAPVIIGVFRLSEEKRPLIFLEVCRAVRRSLPGLRVLIVGEGPLHGRLSRDLEPWIELLGRRSDVAQLLQLSDLLLLTSSHEGMPNVVMEAQLAGLPVVASRTGGLADCVADGQSAILVDPGDLEGYVRGCLRLLFDPAAARAMGARGAKRMREDFTIERMARRYLELAEPRP
jgi:glycosyltransferase involved in cell wall biosynthesis